MNTVPAPNRSSASIAAASLAAALATALACASAGAQPQRAPNLPAAAVTAAVATPRTVPVEIAAPAFAYAQQVFPVGQGNILFGPGNVGGRSLAITSITLNSLSSTAGGSVYIYSASAVGDSCTGTPQYQNNPTMRANVGPNGTTHLAFPSPLVMSANSAATCVGVYASSANLALDVVGFVY